MDLDELFRSCVILGVRPGAPAGEIARAYRDLARATHPDGIQGPAEHRLAEERLREINRAYEVVRSSAGFPGLAGTAPPTEVYDTSSWKEQAASPSAGPAQESSHYERALILYLDGLEQHRARRYREAISSLSQSVFLVRGNPDAFILLARTYRAVGMHAKSESAFREAIRLRPDSLEAHTGLCEALIALGDPAAARHHISSVEVADPTLAELLRHVLAPVVSPARGG